MCICRGSEERWSSGFAVVFAEDVPDVPSQDYVSRKLLSIQCPAQLIRLRLV